MAVHVSSNEVIFRTVAQRASPTEASMSASLHLLGLHSVRKPRSKTTELSTSSASGPSQSLQYCPSKFLTLLSLANRLMLFPRRPRLSSSATRYWRWMNSPRGSPCSSSQSAKTLRSSSSSGEVAISRKKSSWGGETILALRHGKWSQSSSGRRRKPRPSSLTELARTALGPSPIDFFQRLHCPVSQHSLRVRQQASKAAVF